MDGALIIDKVAGMTSHDVVARVRRLLGERSIGHLGTLDPSATGVLPLLLGRLTRLAQFFQSREKEYEGEIIVGWATDTYDATGEALGPKSNLLPDWSAIEAAMARLRGAILQQPPPYSAKKVCGVRAYEQARRHQPVALAPVTVEIHEFAALGIEGNRLAFRLRSSTGAYARSLAHDLGQALGMGAHLGRLRRLRVGEFDLKGAVTLEQLAALAGSGSSEAAAIRDPIGLLVPALRLLPEFPPVIAPPEAAAKILNGRAVNLPEYSRTHLVRVFRPDGSLLSIARRIAGTLFQPKVVFPN